MDYIVTANTDIGISKETNQDSLTVKIINTRLGKVVFALVCDGMGGLQKGEVASASVVKAFDNWIYEKLPELCKSGINQNVIEEQWRQIIEEQNEKIKSYGRYKGISLGTTVVAMLIVNNMYYILNVGDSRVYEITDSISQLTADQTVVARELATGIITEEQALTDERRNILLQCVGASERVYPEMLCGQVKANCVYMLCSDGFRHEISSKEIYDNLNPEVVYNEDSMTRNVKKLIELNKKRLEKDNISVVLIRTY